MDEIYRNTVLLQLPEERFKLQTKAPTHCNMVIEPMRLVFSAVPGKPYVGPLLENGQNYIIEKQNIIKLEAFNKIWHSAATLHFRDQSSQAKVIRIIFSGDLGGNIYETEIIYKNLKSWLAGQGEIENTHSPVWFVFVGIILLVLGGQILGLVGIVLAIILNGFLYWLIRQTSKK